MAAEKLCIVIGGWCAVLCGMCCVLCVSCVVCKADGNWQEGRTAEKAAEENTSPGHQAAPTEPCQRTGVCPTKGTRAPGSVRYARNHFKGLAYAV